MYQITYLHLSSCTFMLVQSRFSQRNTDIALGAAEKNVQGCSGHCNLLSVLCQVEPVKVMEPQIEADGSLKDKDKDGVQDTKALKFK